MDKYFKLKTANSAKTEYIYKNDQDVDDPNPQVEKCITSELHKTSYVSVDNAVISNSILDPASNNFTTIEIGESLIPTMPWPGIEKFFVCKGSKGINLIVHCVLCGLSSRLHGVSKTTPSNLKRHIKRVHQYKINAFENALNEGKQNASNKKRCLNLDSSNEQKAKKKSSYQQLTLERYGSGKDDVTQRKFDGFLLKFIVNETQPLSMVDKPSFLNLVRLGLPKELQIMSSKTLKVRIDNLYKSMKDNIINTLSSVLYVSTTADCWTKGKKSYLGVTCHWINVKTFKRESVSLACCRLKGRHTYDVLAKALHKIHTTYKIQNKIVSTTTDNGSNFVKTLVTYSNNNPDSETSDDENEFTDLFDILNCTSNVDQESDTFIHLPPHFRCASHTLDLIAKYDVDKMINNNFNSCFKKLYRKVLGKCSSIWSKQNMSPLVAEKVHDTLGIYLKIPNKTKWNCMYDALLQIKILLNAHDGLDKVNQVFDYCEIQRFTPQEIQFINEYCDVMSSLANTLDLQSEESMYMGYLLPSLYALEKKLKIIEKRNLVYCEPLLQTIVNSIKKRFEPIWKKKN